MPNVTIKEIAGKTGLARSTVSEILNGKHNFCSQKNRERVIETAKRLGYEPNIGFKIMTGRDTGTASIIFSQERTYQNEYNLQLAMMLLREFELRGESAYTVIMMLDAEANLKRTRELVRRGSRRFIFLGAPVGVEKLYAFLSSEGLPFVSFNGYPNEKGEKNIKIDYEYVYHEYIQYFMTRKVDFVCLLSREYFDKVCRPLFPDFGLVPEDHWYETPNADTMTGDYTEQSFYMIQDFLMRALNRFPDAQGWICGSDQEALGAIGALRGAGKPTENSQGPLVCGLGNTRPARFSPIRLVTADYNLKEASRFLISELWDKQQKGMCLRPKIIYR
ncbi:MAG: Catabolite control protein A [Lentisphaerae bacterium ADurb.Bin242]|nr:MAG: Catabolite control protein A [Lentisphaerae bacterium ADurb.Bin242]